MKTIRKCKTTDLAKKLLLMALPSGILPKNAVMRLDVLDYLVDGYTEQEEMRLRWGVVKCAIRNGLLKKKTFTTKVHNRANRSIVYLITFEGIDFLKKVAADEYPWIKDVADYYKDREKPLYAGLNKQASNFYRQLAAADFELMARELHSELNEGYASGAIDIAIRELINAALDNPDEDLCDNSERETAEGDDCEDKKRAVTLQTVCLASYLAHHSDEPLIESVLPGIPCDGLFINSRHFRDIVVDPSDSVGKTYFASNALGVYLNQKNSFLIFHATRYGMTWSRSAISEDIKKFGIVNVFFGDESIPVNALILVDGSAQFAELFENKWKRKRSFVNRTMIIGAPFNNLYAIPTGPECYEQLEMVKFYGNFFDNAMADKICFERHYGYIKRVNASKFNMTYNDKALLLGSTLNVSRINVMYNDYLKDIKEGKSPLFSIYCETWQKEWFERLFPDLEIYTVDDIPQRSAE